MGRAIYNDEESMRCARIRIDTRCARKKTYRSRGRDPRRYNVYSLKNDDEACAASASASIDDAWPRIVEMNDIRRDDSFPSTVRAFSRDKSFMGPSMYA